MESEENKAMSEQLKVISESNHFIVVVKPVNILSQADHTGDVDMLTLVKEYLKISKNKPREAYAGLVHRLDRMTSGLMVFAKTSKGASRLSEQIKSGEFTKSYLAIVEGLLEGSGTLQNMLVKDEKALKAYVTTNGGKMALLDYEVVSHIGGNTLVKVHLKTGRYHQIRVQFQAIGHPLVGDALYGSKLKCPYKLHAYELKFNDPVSKAELVFTDFPLWYEKK